MTPFDNFLQSLIRIGPSLTIWLLVKLLFIIGSILYVAFGIIVVRQVGLMTQTIQDGFAGSLKIVSWVHLFIAISVLILTIVIL